MRTLRPYQFDCLDQIRLQLAQVMSTVVVLPTGTGKTVVMAKLASEWGNGNVLLLAHRIELLRQAQQKLHLELGYAPPIEQGVSEVDMNCMWQGGAVVIASIQTLAGLKRLERYRQHPFDLILIDECHHAVSATYRRVVEYFTAINPACRVLGVTATPARADKAALGIVFDSTAYNYGVAQAIDDGWLVPVQQEFVGIHQVDFSAVRTAKNTLGEADLSTADLEEVLTQEPALHAMANPLIDICGQRKTLVFTAGVAHAHLLADVLNRHREGCAVAIDGTTVAKQRELAVERFAGGDLQYLVNCGVFTEGFDVPAVEVVAMGRPTKSIGLYMQMLGRGLRPAIHGESSTVVDGIATAEGRRAAIASSSKPHMLSVDFVGNSQHSITDTVDVLGGNYDARVKELARDHLKKQGGSVEGALKAAQKSFIDDKERERRKNIKAVVDYERTSVDPFGGGARPGTQAVEQKRGGSSDAQIALLVNLGVEYTTAAGYSRKQASAVIERLKQSRCTKKQRSILERNGEDPNVPFAMAQQIIDEIAKNGWRPRART